MDVGNFNEIVDLFSDNLYRFALKNLKNKDLSKDIVQESFEKLWINKDKIDSIKAKSYLFTTAYHLIIDHFRREKRVQELDKPDSKNNFDTMSNPDLNEVLHAALDKLTPTQRQIIMLRDYEGYSYEEIGQIANLSESQVKVYIFRARKVLKDFIGKVENVI